MTDKRTTYKKEIIEIADIIFANPDKKMSEIMRVFAGKCGRSTKTVERWISKAKEYNSERQQRQEKVRNEVLADEAKESLKKDLKTREDYLRELENDFEELKAIKAGEVYEDIDPKTGKVTGYRQAGFNDLISAKRSRALLFEKIAGVRGWNAADKIDVKMKTDGFDFSCLTAEEKAVLLSFAEKIEVQE
jgi:hypothetical protein